MNIRRFLLGFTLSVAAVTTALALSPAEGEVRAAVDRLIEAGNYSWSESRAMFTDPLKRNQRTSPTGEGATEVGGFTTAVFFRRQVVLHDSQAALKLSGGWRHARDLTDEEVEELGRLQMSGSRLQRRDTLDSHAVEQVERTDTQKAVAGRAAHAYFHPVPHEVLQFLLARATNFRPAGAAFAADVADTMREIWDVESFILSGRKPLARPATGPAIFGGRPGSKYDQKLPSERRAVLYVTITSGMIEEFAVEYSRETNLSINGAPAERTDTIDVYTTKLFKAGSTAVEVEPEARALFLNVVSSG